MNIYESISKLSCDNKAYLCILLDGEAVGSKLIISDGEIVSGDETALKWADKCGNALAGLSESGIAELNGNRVYAEELGGDKRLVICGAGHVSMQIINIGKMLGYKVTVIDDRLKFVNDAIEHGADEVKLSDFGQALDEIEVTKDTYFVIVTRGHRYDRECLKRILYKPHAYVGMMGSRRRVRIIKDELAAEGIEPELLDSIHMPIGLKIGAETPEEIAVSIMAEIIEIGSGLKRISGFTNEIKDALLTPGREKLVMATIISRKGSAPRGIGTRMLISGNGDIIGTIGGGCIEGNVIAKGRRMLITGDYRPAIVTVDMTNEAAEDEGMVCGGTVDVLLETV